MFKYIASMVPEPLLLNIDIVYIGQFDNLKKRDVRGVFEDGAIFITNEQDTEMDLIDDLIHEIAHSVETAHSDIVYADGGLEKEFKYKRHELYKIFKEKELNPPISLTTDINYNKTIDDYLYKEIGYPALNQIVALAGLFIGSYSTTSIREYFAAAFEAYFLHEKQLVFDYCPVLYSKLKQLDNLEDQ